MLTTTTLRRVLGGHAQTQAQQKAAAATTTWQRARAAAACCRRRSFMSTQAVPAPEEEPCLVLLLGKPGGGKGTISEKIIRDFPKFHHLSTGDLLRQHVREQTQLGKQAAAYMNAGDLVPDTLMMELLWQDARPYVEDGQCLLLDGFPRNVPQAMALEDVAHMDYVVNLDIPTETIVQRIADRWIHPPSGRIYSYSYRPPQSEGVDDVTGEPLVQREDDKPESVRTRLAAYDRITRPLVDWYGERGVLKTFHGTQSDVIYPQVKAWLEEKNFG